RCRCWRAYRRQNDGLLGSTIRLAVLRGQTARLNADQSAYLARRYARPEPRWAFASEVAGLGLITACVDISDGLVADVGHICEASHVEAVIRAEDVPVSDAARTVLADTPMPHVAMLCGGDDYELAFTAPQSARYELERIAAAHDLAISTIGSIQQQPLQGSGRVCILDANGSVLKLPNGGYQHL
ncbi:MAG: hypothetical protein JKY27_13270, partial [Magnetovibrio sp.]|nr:hypothetical protein [Magnetovibrio sp.]